jgi:hypothetical protein
MTNKDIIKQYVDTGICIPEYQMNKLSPNLLKSYLRKRIIAFDTSKANIMVNGPDIDDDGNLSYRSFCNFLQGYEHDLLDGKQKEEYEAKLDEIPDDQYLTFDDDGEVIDEDDDE